MTTREASETKSGDGGAMRGCACVELDASACKGPTRGALHVAYGSEPCPCACHGGPSPDAQVPVTLAAVWRAADAFCAAIRPGAGYPSVADLCQAVAAHHGALLDAEQDAARAKLARVAADEQGRAG